MRALVPAGLLLALLALAPLAAPTPATCADPCVIQSHSAAAVPIVTEVASGGSVVWQSLDTSHVNADGRGLGDEDACFVATFSQLASSYPVRFDIVDGLLKATTTTPTKQTVRDCTLAQPLPDGSFLVDYHCRLHPQMRAALVVTPT